MKKPIGMVLLILLAGSIPISIYFFGGRQAWDINTASLPIRSLTQLEQLAQVLAGLLIKPTYMMLSLMIILALFGQRRPPIFALWLGQMAFFTGELFCAINFYMYRHQSMLSEYLHSYGMVLALGFTSYALINGLEMRIAGSRKLQHEVKVILRFLLPMFAILCFIPILSSIQPDAYAVSIFHYQYSYTRLDMYQLYEARILPWLAFTGFSIAFLLLLNKDDSVSFTANVFICAGLGALGFSIFRVALNGIYAENFVWFEFWEEMTELMFVGFIAFILWRYKKILLERTHMIEDWI